MAYICLPKLEKSIGIQKRMEDRQAGNPVMSNTVSALFIAIHN